MVFMLQENVMKVQQIDRWYEQHLFKPETDALKEFISILRDVKLCHLAHSLETNSQLDR